MKTFLKNPEKKGAYMAQRTKSKQMKIKQPSLKGMKNTKYLGHFAQDKYIQKGHNLSGVFPTADIEKFAVSNPFEAKGEMQRRQGIVEQEYKKLNQQAEEAVSSSQARAENIYNQFVKETPNWQGRNFAQDWTLSNYIEYQSPSEGQTPQQQRIKEWNSQIRQERLSGLQESQKIAQEMSSLRGRRKKFLEEL